MHPYPEGGVDVLVNLGYVDFYVKEHVAELVKQVENDRLADLAIGPGRPLRARLAERVYAVAEWVEGSRSRSAMGLHSS
jgi:hypothetical protein